MRRARVEVADGTVRLALHADGDVGLARWAAEREVELFRHAFGRELVVLGGGPRRVGP